VKFIDEATITVQSGNGGRGCVSFRREKFIPRGGPDGGDGGKGGDVVLITTQRKRTLKQFQYKRQFKAANGGHGQGAQKTGRNGADLIIELPPGTIILNAENGSLIKDMASPDERFVLARGGRGGLGNTRFKSSTNRTPRYAQPGEPGISLVVKLELKLLADVGIIGMPNAGKSTLLSAISAARPKTADYPFTTLNPYLGVVRTEWAEPFVVADIPGLIDGAHQGAGLGHRFLKHIERTRILLHLIDAHAIDPDRPLAALDTVNRELSLYNPSLGTKPQMIVLNKLDLPEAAQKAEIFRQALPGEEVVMISAQKAEGLAALTSKLTRLLDGD
jgi:GTP-binding protein